MRLGLILSLALSLLLGCSGNATTCRTDADCPPGQTCATTGGVFFAGGTCVSEQGSVTQDGGPDDAGSTGPDSSPDEAEMGTGPTDASDAVDSSDPRDVSPPPDSSPPPPTSIEAVRERLWEAACSAAFECPSKSSLELVTTLGRRFESKDDCEAADPFATFLDLHLVEQSIQEGRLSVTGTLTDLEQCVDSYGDHWCEGALLAEACGKLLRGNVEQGGVCATEMDCTDGRFCKRDSDCLGTCEDRDSVDCNSYPEACGRGMACGEEGCRPAEFLLKGAICSQDAQCPSDAVCSISGRRCEKVVFATPGESCDTLEDATYCVAGSVCITTEGDNYFCGPPRLAGESCELTIQCHHPLVCLAGLTDTCGEPGGPDEECATDEHCAGSARCIDNQCNANACPLTL